METRNHNLAHFRRLSYNTLSDHYNSWTNTDRILETNNNLSGELLKLAPNSWVNRTFRRSRSAYRPKHNVIQVLPGTSVVGGLKGEGGETIAYGKKRCRVLFSYTPAHDDELSLEVDETIDYICEVEDGWWKGRLNGRVGVFPSNFVEMCNSDCDLTPNNHAATVLEKNKKNSLQGSPMTNGSSVFSHSTPNRVSDTTVHKENNSSRNNESINKENRNTEQNSANLSVNSPSSQMNGSMTTSERLLRNTAPAPDTAPRLPPKPETSTPIQVNAPTTPDTSCQSLYPKVPISSSLFDPEDEPLGPMFGSLSTRIQEETGSIQFVQCSKRSQRRSSLQVFPRENSDKPSKGLFSRIRHSFGSRGSLGLLSRSRLNVGNIEETQSAHVVSPQVKRRRSFASMIRKYTSFSSKDTSKYQIKIERSNSSNIEEDIYPTLPKCGTGGSCLGIDPFMRSSTRDCPQSSINSMDQISQEASLSWVFQDMGMKTLPARPSEGHVTREERLSISAPGNPASCLASKLGDFESVGRHYSGDSGVAWESNLHSHTQSTKDMDSFFGSIGDLTDDMFNDIFPPVALDPEFKTIQEEVVEGKVLSLPPCTSLNSKPVPKPRGRNPIRTNPHVGWNPPASVKKLVRVQVTEI